MYNVLENIWPASESWLKVCNVERTEYHGGCFTGPDSKKLLVNVSQLENLAPNNAVKQYVNSFRLFNDVFYIYTFICLRRTLYKMAHIFMKQRILAQTDILNVTHIHLTQQNGFVRHYH